MLRFHGAWRITVVGRSADFDQRVVVRGAYGLRVLPGRVGAAIDVDEESWTLSLEHHLWGRSWQPNLRTTPGPVTEHDGLRSQLLTSNDCHWPGKPLDYVNFVLRLDQAVAPAAVPVRAARVNEAPVGAPVQAVRTVSSGWPEPERERESRPGREAERERGTAPAALPPRLPSPVPSPSQGMAGEAVRAGAPAVTPAVTR
ncbi:hypothetical protein ACIQOW_27720 [Kitasatospora sp. NPDC091335]|uniref:hypothetical protein n=1 Tax=Kitasatospora sp. NPDC091335 TaxID=3364085 RepID=UPI0037F3EC0D